MIAKLNHTESAVSAEILQISLAAYTIEAQLIEAAFFPPLQEQQADISQSESQFFGYFEAGQLAGVIEIETLEKFWTIARLVVSPNYFRRGIGRKLVQFAIDHFAPCRVSTASTNLPAIALYEKMGFVQLEAQQNVAPNITIITLQRHDKS